MADQNRAPEAAAVLDEVTMSFGSTRAVDGISFAVQAGTILGLIGPSGAGKTTTIRLLNGGLAPKAGTVRVLGEDPRRFSRRTRERIGYMPQGFALWPDLTGRENLNFVGSLFGVPWGRRAARVREELEMVDLWDARNTRAGHMSGGMQRRLALASALVHDPILAFLDEPTGGLDPLLRATVWDELHRRKREGRTMVVTTQYLNEAEECDVVALISNGHLVALTSPEDLRRLATEGDIVEVETRTAFDPSRLAGVAAVRAVRQVEPKLLHVTLDDAGAGTPGLIEAIEGSGAEVVSVREYRPSMDDVFAELVERDRVSREAAATAA